MNSNAPPLFELFTYLREGLRWPLGPEDYLAFIHALQAGYGLPDRRALERLCCTLWAKSVGDQQVISHYLQHYFELLPTEEPDEMETPPSEESDVYGQDKVPDKPKEKKSDDEWEIGLPVVTFDPEFPAFDFKINTSYFPITRRQLKQSWRYLLRTAYEGPGIDVDVETTTRVVSHQGFFLQPVLVQRPLKITNLILLIDRNGSMVPFHLLSERIVDSIQKGFRHGRLDIFYFHNYPQEYLYEDPFLVKGVPLQETLKKLATVHTGVAVLSDGGAARGGFNEDRLKATAVFLRRCRQHFAKRVVWLNPLRRRRWQDTTAEEIAWQVDMFPLNYRDLNVALRILRGKTPKR